MSRHAAKSGLSSVPPAVDVLEDRIAPAIFVVISAADSGPGTLRQAIFDANLNINVGGPDRIVFNIPGTGVQTIQPTTALPVVTDSVVIEGYSQPGSSVNTSTTGNNARPLIEIDGTLAGQFTSGLELADATSAVNGLIINRFGQDGLVLGGEGVNHVIDGNWIGVDDDGVTPAGNGGHGVRVFGFPGGTIGGANPELQNIIANNGGDGVSVTGNAARISVVGNAIFDNVGLGIDLGNDGPTDNDPGDSDTGPNNRQNYPVPATADTDGGTVTVTGTFASTPNTEYRLEFFASTATNPSDVRGGQRFLGSANRTLDGTGTLNFSIDLPAVVAPGEFITATASVIDPTGPFLETSEFSLPIPTTTVPTGGVIEGQKFLDINADGIRDPGEPGLDGWTIQLFDDAGNLVAEQVTGTMDLDGNGIIEQETERGLYRFTGLAIGDYRVVEVQQDGVPQTVPGEIAFSELGEFAAGEQPRSIVSTDIDGDGDVDLVMPGASDNTVSVLLNNGDGTFAEPRTTSTLSNAPFSVAADDLDGDGDIDLATANFLDSTVTILENYNGNGGLQRIGTLSVGTDPYFITSADLDGDGDSDLITASFLFRDGTVSILLNHGDGSFAPATNYSVGRQPGFVASADLDGDGDVDLAVSNYSGDTVSILFNNGDGTFAPASSLLVGDSPRSIAIADFDNDGDNDLVVVGTRYLATILNNGDGSFAPSTRSQTSGHTIAGLAAADFDRDGDVDVAIVSTTALFIHRNNGDGSFDFPGIFGMPGNIRRVNADFAAAADFDGDGNVDLAASSFFRSSVKVLRNRTGIPTVTLPAADSVVSNIDFGNVPRTQVVSGARNELDVVEGSRFRVPVEYTTTDNDETLTGLGVRLHFDSSFMTFDGLSGLLADNLISQEVADDLADYDGDPNTDRYVLVTWSDLRGEWPDSELPTELYDANFQLTPASTIGETTRVRFTSTSTAVTHGFAGIPVDVEVVAASLDVDDNGVADALSDGLLFVRAMFGFDGETLTRDAVALNANRTDPLDLQLYIEQMLSLVGDLDGNGEVNALTDGVLLQRYLFGSQGAALIDGLVDPAGTRNDAADIVAFLDPFHPNPLGLTTAATAAAPGVIGNQVVTGLPISVDVASGGAFSLDVNYQTDPLDTSLSGLGLRMHFDSSKVSFEGADLLTPDGFPLLQVLDDDADWDNDPSTDRFVLVAYLDATGNWPGAAQALLYSAGFQADPAFAGQSTINFTASSTPLGFTLQTTSVPINVWEPQTVQWAASTSGDWNDGGNWSTGAVPLPGDRVVIDVPDRDITVRYDLSRYSLSSLTSTERLEIVDGSLKIVDPIDARLEVADLVIHNGASLTVDRATVEITSGGMLANAGALTIVHSAILISENGTLANRPGAQIDIVSASGVPGSSNPVGASGVPGSPVADDDSSPVQIRCEDQDCLMPIMMLAGSRLVNQLGANLRIEDATIDIVAAGIENAGNLSVRNSPITVSQAGELRNLTGGGIDIVSASGVPGLLLPFGASGVPGNTNPLEASGVPGRPFRFIDGSRLVNQTGATIQVVDHEIEVADSTLDNAGTFDIDGRLQILANGALVNQFGGRLDIVSASGVPGITADGGDIDNQTGATILVNGGVEVIGPRSFLNAGDVRITDGSLSLRDGVAVSNLFGARIDILSASGVPGLVAANSDVTNAAGATFLVDGSVAVAGPNAFPNAGTLQITNGSLSLSNGFRFDNQPGARLDIVSASGVPGVSAARLPQPAAVGGPGSGLWISAGSRFDNRADAVVELGANPLEVLGDFNNAGVVSTTIGVNLLGGTFAGVGTVNANIVNDGVLRPGLVPGVLTIDGDYTQTANGRLDLERNANPDQVVVTGDINLGGSIDLSGVYSFGGRNVRIEQSGDALTFINENGDRSPGRFTGLISVMADGWAGGLVANVNGGRIAWHNGTTWEAPQIGGEFTINGLTTRVSQIGNSLTFVNEFGNVARGRLLNGSQVIADDWAGGLVGRIRDNGIAWNNGTTWSAPDLAGTWSIDGRAARIERSGTSLTFVNEFGNRANGRMLSDTQVIADGWGGLTGNLINGRIEWANGTTWSNGLSDPFDRLFSNPDAVSKLVA